MGRNVKSILLAALLAVWGGEAPTSAQTGQYPPYSVQGNPTAVQAPPRASSFSSLLVPKSVTSVDDFGASGSTQATTGTISAASAVLTLAAPIDFANTHGVRVNHAGPAYALNPPTALGVVNVGAAGTTTYTYTVSCFDNAGGIDAALTSVATATGNAVLSTTNYNTVSWTAPTGTAPAGCAVWGNVAGSLTLRAMLPATAVSWNDYGLAAITPPDWLGATPPAAQAADWLITRVASGAGTTSLTLNATANTTATAQVVAHDDRTAIQNAINSLSPNGGMVYLPAGTFNVNTYLSLGTFPIKFQGSGWGSTFIKSPAPARDLLRQENGGGLTAYSDISLTSDFIRTGGAGFNALGGSYTSVDNVHTFNMFDGFILNNNGVRLNNIDIRNTAPVYGVGLLIPASNDQYFNNVVMDSSMTGLGNEPRACVEVTQNGGLWGSNSDFIHCGSAGLLVDPQNTQSVKWIFFSSVAFDTSVGDGIYLNPAAGGTVVGAFFTNSWTASMQGIGIHLGNTGTIGETNFVGHRSQNNQKHGAFIEGGADTFISSSAFTGNSQAGSGLYDGIAVSSTANLNIVGNRIGQVAGITTNFQHYGIELMTGGTVASVHIEGNDVSFNVTSGLRFGGTITGQTQILGNVPATNELNVNFGGTFQGPKMASNVQVAIGAVPTPTGTCTITTQTGGMSAGTFTASGACAGGTVILTFGTTVAHGFSCSTHNQTTPANLMNQTATTTASATFTGTMANADVVSFSCMGY